MSKTKPQGFAIIKGASNWRMFNIFDDDPIVTGVKIDHPNNAHNGYKNIPSSYSSRYPAKKACASLNEKNPGAYYGICRIIEE